MTGTGTQTDPYIITTADELYEMGTLGGASVYFKLGADIDFNGTAYAENYSPITFKCAEFDGDGHTIRNIYVTNSQGTATAFKGNSGATVSVKNVIFEGIYLTGTYTYLFYTDSASQVGKINMYNCRVVLHIRRSGSQLNGASDYLAVIDGGYSRVNLELCTFVINAYMASPFPLFAYCSLKRSQLRVDFTFDSLNTTTYNRFAALIHNTTAEDTYVFGKIKNQGASGDYYFANSGTHTNSYQVIEYENVANVYWNSSFSTPCFADSDVAGISVIDSGSTGKLYNLTTEQCKDAEYLKSIGFMCEGAD